jgi:hypothetical protein
MQNLGQHVELQTQIPTFVELLLGPTDLKKSQKPLRLAGQSPQPVFHAGRSTAAICLVVLTTQCGLLPGVLEDRADDP